MIKNINYKGQLSNDQMQRLKFDFRIPPPQQLIIPLGKISGKLLIFKSGKCRLMGLRQPINEKTKLPLSIMNLELQSATAVIDMEQSINIPALIKQLPENRYIFEPELFPALRLTVFNPLCVNVFATGKVVVLGLKELTNQNILIDIKKYINRQLQTENHFSS